MRCLLVAVAIVPFALLACADESIDAIENQPPVAIVSGGGTAARGSVVLLDGSLSSDAEGDIAAFAWTFGDGSAGDGAQVSHIYNSAGTFEVALTVTDKGGESDTATLTVVIDDNQAPLAVITAPSTGAIAGLLHFEGLNSSDADGTVSSYSWDFGDGVSATGALVDKVFDDAGSFTVTLTVTDNDGAQGEAQHTINIAEGPASFNGQWSWFLVDPSQRTLCDIAEFQESQLTILTNGTSITITEVAAGQSFPYLGTLTGSDFSVVNADSLQVQTIAGTFTSATEFAGTYRLAVELLECDDALAVFGSKN